MLSYSFAENELAFILNRLMVMSDIDVPLKVKRYHLQFSILSKCDMAVGAFVNCILELVDKEGNKTTSTNTSGNINTQ